MRMKSNRKTKWTEHMQLRPFCLGLMLTRSGCAREQAQLLHVPSIVHAHRSGLRRLVSRCPKPELVLSRILGKEKSACPFGMRWNVFNGGIARFHDLRPVLQLAFYGEAGCSCPTYIEHPELDQKSVFCWDNTLHLHCQIRGR